MFSFLTLLAPIFQQSDETGMFVGLLGGVCGGLIGLAVAVVELIAMWKIFTKAGKPGWAAIIPIYNMFILLEIVGREWWWLLLYFVPLVNIVVAVMVILDLAKSFGKGTGFALGLMFLSGIFILILGFGDAQYLGPASGNRYIA